MRPRISEPVQHSPRPRPAYMRLLASITWALVTRIAGKRPRAAARRAAPQARSQVRLMPVRMNEKLRDRLRATWLRLRP